MVRASLLVVLAAAHMISSASVALADWTIEYSWINWSDGTALGWRSNTQGYLTYTYGNGLQCAYFNQSGTHANVDVALAWVHGLLEDDVVGISASLRALNWPSFDFCPRLAAYWNPDNSDLFSTSSLAGIAYGDSECGEFYQSLSLVLSAPPETCGLTICGNFKSSQYNGFAVNHITLTLPDHAYVVLPDGDYVSTEPVSLSSVKALY